MRHVEGAHDLLVVLRVLGRRIRKDEDRPLVDHFVRQLVHRHDLIERLLERRAVELHGDLTIGDFAVVRDVDAGHIRDRVEDVLQARVVVADARQRSREADQRRRLRRGAGAFAHLFDLRPRARRLDALADRSIELGHLGGRLPIAGIVLARLTVLAERRLELILLLEVARLVEMRSGRGDHRALQRDLVVRVVGRRLHRLAIRGDGFVEVARLRGGLGLAERLAGHASGPEERNRQQRRDRQSAVGPPESSGHRERVEARNQRFQQNHDPDSRIV